ncbi:hypothetical protein NP493_105g02011 [Ridgeia piscesae]|uniref:Uncharacterized protein n=1 Tax=Ridgeia piscesae TaxID=27915 RepID=A0AAD9P7B4_RIDPI|nr:hypothetical protein NP493_105g02011 [Ridgeia piscesae]
MFLASEVWRFYHTTFFINTESVRRAVTGILVFGTLVAYIVDKTKPDLSCYEIVTDNDVTEFKPYTKKPKLKYQPLKKTQKPTTAAPADQPGQTPAGNGVGPGSGTGRDGMEGDQAPLEDTRPTTSRQSHVIQVDNMTPVDTPEVTTTTSHEEGDAARQDDTTPTQMSPAEGDTAREDDMTSTSQHQLQQEVDLTPDDEPAEQDDDTAPLVTEDSDTTPAPDNKTGGNTSDQ